MAAIMFGCWTRVSNITGYRAAQAPGGKPRIERCGQTGRLLSPVGSPRARPRTTSLACRLRMGSRGSKFVPHFITSKGAVMAGLSRTLWGLALIGTTLVACGSRSELYAFGAGGPGILPGGGDD